MAIPPAWHPDPTGRHEHRYWDGEQWTDHVADAGQASIDPVAGEPAGTESSGSQSGSTQADNGDPASSDAATGDAASGDAAGDQASDAASATADSGDDRNMQTHAEHPPTTAGGTGESQELTSAVEDDGTQPQSEPAPTSASSPAAPDTPTPVTAADSADSAGAAAPQGAQPVSASTSASSASNGPAVLAMIIGLVALLGSWTPLLGILGGTLLVASIGAIVLLGGVIAIISGVKGRAKAQHSGQGVGMAVTGIVTGSLAVLASALFLAFGVFLTGFSSEFSDFAECIEQTGDEQACTDEFERSLLDRLGQ